MPLGIDRRSEPRRRVTDGTATVRVAGLPVFQFPMQNISANGTCFLVEADAAILRNLHVGQQIDIRLRLPRVGETAVFQKAQVMHIIPSAEPSQRGFFRLGVRILSRLVFRS
jgi:hypothetical protein